MRPANAWCGPARLKSLLVSTSCYLSLLLRYGPRSTSNNCGCPSRVMIAHAPSKEPAMPCTCHSRLLDCATPKSPPRSTSAKKIRDPLRVRWCSASLFGSPSLTMLTKRVIGVSAVQLVWPLCHCRFYGRLRAFGGRDEACCRTQDSSLQTSRWRGGF